jgi:hypothetical protein
MSQDAHKVEYSLLRACKELGRSLGERIDGVTVDAPSTSQTTEENFETLIQ